MAGVMWQHGRWVVRDGKRLRGFVVLGDAAAFAGAVRIRGAERHIMGGRARAAQRVAEREAAAGLGMTEAREL